MQCLDYAEESLNYLDDFLICQVKQNGHMEY
jgi:hypothetical protein